MISSALEMLRSLIAFLQCLFMREFWQEIGRLLRVCAKWAYWYTHNKARRAAWRVWFVLQAIALEPLACCDIAWMSLVLFLLTGSVKPE